MFSFLILSNLLNIGKNCCELRSEKREVLLVSFSDFAHFVFAIILFSQEIDNAQLIKDCIENGYYDKGIGQILQWQKQTIKAIGLTIK